MRRLIPRRLTVVNVAVALVVFAALGGVAYAASGGSFVGPHGNINTCVPRSGGEVNVGKASPTRPPLQRWPGFQTLTSPPLRGTQVRP